MILLSAPTASATTAAAIHAMVPIEIKATTDAMVDFFSLDFFIGEE